MRPMILLFLISAGATTPAVQPQSIDACGWLGKEAEGCISFHAIDGNCYSYGTNLEAIPDSIMEYLDVIRIQANVTLQDWCGTSGRLVVENPLITSCELVDFGCGTVYFDDLDHCNVWISSVYGGLVFHSWHGEGFANGDTVHALGRVDSCVASTCVMSGVLHDVTFYPCGGSPEPVNRDTWGALKMLFR